MVWAYPCCKEDLFGKVLVSAAMIPLVGDESIREIERFKKQQRPRQQKLSWVGSGGLIGCPVS
jgi:hypothetical protein